MPLSFSHVAAVVAKPVGFVNSTDPRALLAQEYGQLGVSIWRSTMCSEKA